MKLNMIVVMTMWLPRLAWRYAGMKAQAAPAARRRAENCRQRPGQPAEIEGDQPDGQAADIGLSFPADVEQPAVERHRDRQTGEDEVGRIDRA